MKQPKHLPTLLYICTCIRHETITIPQVSNNPDSNAKYTQRTGLGGNCKRAVRQVNMRNIKDKNQCFTFCNECLGQNERRFSQRQFCRVFSENPVLPNKLELKCLYEQAVRCLLQGH